MLSTSTPKPTTNQVRLKRFIRQPEKLGGRQITPKGLEAVAIIERYRFVPSSLLVRLMSGAQRNNYRHLQTLFHHGLVNRFCLPKYGGPGEFIYYLDSVQSLLTLIQEGLLTNLTDDQRKQKQEIIRLNREKVYHQLHRDAGSQGRVLYIQHELMISRFHAMLELASRKLPGKVSLEMWKQGTELWNRVTTPKVTHDGDTWMEQATTTELLPHRPDAFFTLYFPGRPADKQHVHFMYEADRGSENTSRFKMKLRAHWHFIVKQNLQRTIPCYGVHSIRAVLTESTTSQWAHNLRDAARHPIVSPNPSPLFWFTTSELLTKPVPAGNRTVPLYLEQPETIFKRIWANPWKKHFSTWQTESMPNQHSKNKKRAKKRPVAGSTTEMLADYLKQETPVNTDLIAALRAVQEDARHSGLNKLSQWEINAEITASRRERQEKPCNR